MHIHANQLQYPGVLHEAHCFGVAVETKDQEAAVDARRSTAAKDAGTRTVATYARLTFA